MEPINTLDILRYKKGQWCREKDLIIKEVPVTLYVNGKKHITILASPRHLDELALGYLVAEGCLTSVQQIGALEVGADKDWVRVDLKAGVPPPTQVSERGPFKGRTDGDLVCYRLLKARGIEEVDTDLTISPMSISLLAAELQRHSQLFRETGGVHGAALADEEKGIFLFREDIGRHNAIDKIVGHTFLKGLSCRDKIFLTSGRVSFDTMVKTIKLGVPIIISPSAPTDMAVQMARNSQMTLVGFARGKRFNVYSGEGRLGV